jgi:hypothetical protein
MASIGTTGFDIPQMAETLVDRAGFSKNMGLPQIVWWLGGWNGGILARGRSPLARSYIAYLTLFKLLTSAILQCRPTRNRSVGQYCR